MNKGDDAGIDWNDCEVLLILHLLENFEEKRSQRRKNGEQIVTDRTCFQEDKQ